MAQQTPWLQSNRTMLPAVTIIVLSLLFSCCVKRQREGISSRKPSERTAAPAQSSQTKADAPQPSAPPQTNSAASSQPAPPRININTASAGELEKLPGIGKGFARRIVEHREKYGPFRRPEHLIMVRGLSDRRFRALRELITVE